jgi:phosphoacetylglucosamine mutase
MNIITNLLDSLTDPPIKYPYGTAGFRSHHTIIHTYIIPKIPIILKYICYLEKWHKIGIMITASHNHVDDNGVKFISNKGNLLNHKLELIINKIMNLPEFNYKKIEDLISQINYKCLFIIGYDTRPSSIPIKNYLIYHATNQGIHTTDMDHTTTPQLHMLLTCIDLDYINFFTNKFKKIINNKNRNYKKLKLLVDCANGVGSIVVSGLKNTLKDYLTILPINTHNYDKVNDMCGSDYILNTRNLPTNFNPDIHTDLISVSFDGDADRIIFFQYHKNKIRIFDGDKIGTLIAKYISQYTDLLSFNTNICYVQTRYANSASTEYIVDYIRINQKFVKTGVKHLSREAEKYDIGIYFESNGHGTVLFNAEYIQNLVILLNTTENPIEKYAAEELINLYYLMNQKVGDSISTMLVVSYILIKEDINIKDWYDSYINIPSKQYKINREINMILSDDEGRILYPKKIQEFLDTINNSCDCRSFIRPSGTEKCLRLYIECPAKKELDEIADLIITRISNF